MDLHELLNKNLSLIEIGKTSEAGISHPKAWFNKNEVLFVSHKNIEQFNFILESIYSHNEKIYTKFTRQKIYKFIEDEIVKKRRKKLHLLKKNLKFFFKYLKNKNHILDI